MAVADTKVPLFKDNFRHFQIKIKISNKSQEAGQHPTNGADCFWIIP